MTRLHDILNASRNRLGLTYEQVHERLEAYPWPEGVSKPSLPVVGHWLNGTRRPRNMEHLKALCRVLEVSLDDAVQGRPAEVKTAEEQVMLDLFREAGNQGRELLLAMGKQMEGRGTK
jgi:transcriptional regulator with XRE-family HTH domain